MLQNLGVFTKYMYKGRYEEYVIILKHGLPEAPKQGEMRNKQRYNKCHMKSTTNRQRRIAIEEPPWNGQ